MSSRVSRKMHKAVSFLLNTAAATVGSWLGNAFSPGPQPVIIQKEEIINSKNVNIEEKEQFTSFHIATISLTVIVVVLCVVLCWCKISKKKIEKKWRRIFF